MALGPRYLPAWLKAYTRTPASGAVEAWSVMVPVTVRVRVSAWNVATDPPPSNSRLVAPARLGELRNQVARYEPLLANRRSYFPAGNDANSYWPDASVRVVATGALVPTA